MSIDYLTMARAISELYNNLQQAELANDLASHLKEADLQGYARQVERREQHKREAEIIMKYISVRFKDDFESLPDNLKDIYNGK